MVIELPIEAFSTHFFVIFKFQVVLRVLGNNLEMRLYHATSAIVGRFFVARWQHEASCNNFLSYIGYVHV